VLECQQLYEDAYYHGGALHRMSAFHIFISEWRNTEHGWVHRRQKFLTQAYRNLLPDTKSASVPAVTTLRSTLSMYIILYIITFFLISCLFNSSPEVIFRIAFA
jgi:hypothetical protein